MKRLLKRVSALMLSLMITAVCFSAPAKADEVTDATSTAVTGSYEDVSAAFEYPAAQENIEVDVGKVLGEQNVSLSVQIPEDAVYTLGIEYKGMGEENSDFTFRVKIDGKYPFSEAEDLKLYRIFRDKEGRNRKDAQGNEFSPRQVHYESYFYDEVTDVTRWTDDCYMFELKAGEHEVVFEAVEGTFEIKKVTFAAPEVYRKYSAPESKSEYYKGDPVIIECENAKLKTGYWLQSKSDNSTLDVSPNDVHKVLANYIGGGTWKTSGQMITWETPEMEAGY